MPEWLGLTPETAQALLDKLLAIINACNIQLYGTDAIPAVKLLLQSLVDLLTCSYDRMKAAAKPPAAAEGQQEQQQEQQPAEQPHEEEQQPAEEQAPAVEPAAGREAPIESSTLPRGTGLLILL